MTGLRVLGLQLDARVCTTSAEIIDNLNLAQVSLEAHLGQNPNNPIDLLLLGELYTCGYGNASLANIERVSEDLEGQSCVFFKLLARTHGIHICWGFPRRVKTHWGIEYRISQAVVDPTGSIIALYDKMHLCSYGDCTEKNVRACLWPFNREANLQLRSSLVALNRAYL
jgi:predicted amidohydrolase